MAQVLCHDEVGRERDELLGIHGVEAFPARDQFAHLPVNFALRRGGVHAGTNQRRLAAALRAESRTRA